MSLLLLASATEIAQWAATRASQDRVPELLRRLVYATTDAPRYVEFPSGDAVQLDGWDGVVELGEDSAVIPRGPSVWEIGISAKSEREGGRGLNRNEIERTLVGATGGQRSAIAANLLASRPSSGASSVPI